MAIRRVITAFKKKSSVGIKTNRAKYDENQDSEALPKMCINYKGTESNSTVEKHGRERLMNVSITRDRQTEATRSQADTRRTRP